MLYQFIDDHSEQKELFSSDEEEILNKKEIHNRKRKSAEEIAAISKNFIFEFSNDTSTEISSDLDGLKKFLKQNSQNNTSRTLSEKINNERKLNNYAATHIFLKDDLCFKKDEDTNTDSHCQPEKALFSNDRLRIKSHRKNRRKSNPEKLFDDDSQQIINESNSIRFFDDLGLSKSLLKAIFEAGFHQPTPIQIACIPVALAGRDICACSSTGTGKTAAFILPILERLLYKPNSQKRTTKVLILVPTRELAIQVFQVSRRLAKYTPVEFCLAAGGLDIKTQEATLRLGLDIVIATPGRLIDHLNRSTNFSLRQIEVLVLDEADRMLDEQFKDQMTKIINLCAKNRQTMLFSATMTDEIEDLAKLSLNKPVKLFVDENTDLTRNLKQEFIRIRTGNDERRKREAIIAALVTREFTDHTIIFMRTKNDCMRVNILLGLLDVKIAQLHGGISQVKRIENLCAFKQQKDVKILCATELAARGLDIEGVTTVINMHMPKTLKQYIHRVGRTARAGKAGRSISLIGEDDRKLFKEIMKMNRKNNHNLPIQRTIHSDVIDAYQKQIKQFEPSIERLLIESTQH